MLEPGRLQRQNNVNKKGNAMKKDKKVGAILQTELNTAKFKVIYALIFVSLIIMAAAAVLPTVWIMLSGFKDVKEIYSVPPTLLPKTIKLSKLWNVWKRLELGRNYLNSLYILIGEVVFAVIVNALGGYVISKIKPKGSKFIFLIVVWTMLMPSAGRTIPIYMEIVKMPVINISLLDTYWPMWLMAGANSFSLLLFKNFFDSVSRSLVEAARIDGATELGIFFKIMLPLSVPVLAYVGMMAAQNSWGAFFWPNIVLNDQNLVPMATKLYKMKTGLFSMDEQFLALIFSVVPMAVIFICFQKYIMGGINIGGVKG